MPDFLQHMNISRMFGAGSGLSMDLKSVIAVLGGLQWWGRLVAKLPWTVMLAIYFCYSKYEGKCLQPHSFLTVFSRQELWGSFTFTPNLPSHNCILLICEWMTCIRISKPAVRSLRSMRRPSPFPTPIKTKWFDTTVIIISLGSSVCWFHVYLQ